MLMTTMPRHHVLLLLALLAAAGHGLIATPAAAEERTMTDEQRQAIAQAGALESATPDRPANLPDLTKGEPAGEPGKYGQHIWPLGPTGMFGHMVGGPKGDQIEVTVVQPGSPAEGKLRWGDVIVGVGGQKFEAGGNMGMVLGKAIVEAERAVNGGKLVLRVWRDLNFLKRNQGKDIRGADVDQLIDRAVSDDALYEWRPAEEKADAVRNSNFEEFPIKGEVMDVTLQLEVLPDYSETSPYDCPKAKAILENAYEVLEAQFEAGKIRAGRRGTIAALALVASGKPEHRALVKEWVRSPNAKQWHPSIADRLDINEPKGYQSWRMSFDGLDCAVYYHATGDEFVLPAVRAYAVHTAKGQAGGGSWGHTFAWPSFNGGELHGMNPGYGALNAAGNRCFMLLALAKKLGVEHPEIDQAIERSSLFFGSYFEKGAVPYGHHPAAASDDSNGKNVGVAFALKLMGDKQRARWFAQMSSHASFTRRGGHGSGYFWHYSPLAATLLGPRATIATHRNLRWRFTLCRQFDGSFTLHSNYGKENLRNPTATYALHYSAPMQQTLWTGKDADPSMFWTDQEFQDLLTIAQGQFNDESLLEQAGPRVTERSTDEVFSFLGVFKPKARHQFARELARRYEAGEKDILPRLATLLESDNPRLRSAACRALKACGPDATLQYMSGVVKLLNDEQEFVRMRAVETVSNATQDADIQALVLRSTISHEGSETMSPNSMPAVTQGALFVEGSPLTTEPFSAGIDEGLVRDALEKLLTLDPAGSRPLLGNSNLKWDKDTAVRIAGPLVYAAEVEQVADQMFSSRRPNTLALLGRLGYQEAIDASVSYLRKYLEIPRHVRNRVTYKRGLIEPEIVMAKPEAAAPHLGMMRRLLLDKPLFSETVVKGEIKTQVYLYEVMDELASAEQSVQLPSLGDQADTFFRRELANQADGAARLAFCRETLADRKQRDYFRKMSAMSWLVEQLGHEAMPDLLPYLSHEHWRVRDRARDLATGLTKAHGDVSLIDAFADADDQQAIGILAVLAAAPSSAGEQLAERALGHTSSAVRARAVVTLYATAGEAALPRVFAVMKSAEHKRVLLGCEEALLPGIRDGSTTDRVRAEAVAQLPDAGPELAETLYWLIGQCGGPESISVLTAAADTQDDARFDAAVNALSYSPDPVADDALLEIIKSRGDGPRADRVAAHSVRRMVVSDKGIGQKPVEDQLDFAEGVLDVTLNKQTIAYLGRIKTGRCAYILQRAMRRGAPTSAAQAIIDATSDLSDADKKDRKLAESALIDVIEFIEITYLRGGAAGQLERQGDTWKSYARWKAISAQAGQNLLKLKQTEQAPLPTFDDMDLDL